MTSSLVLKVALPKLRSKTSDRHGMFDDPGLCFTRYGRKRRRDTFNVPGDEKVSSYNIIAGCREASLDVFVILVSCLKGCISAVEEFYTDYFLGAEIMTSPKLG
jgi:hypothetical protein